MQFSGAGGEGCTKTENQSGSKGLTILLLILVVSVNQRKFNSKACRVLGPNRQNIAMLQTFQRELEKDQAYASQASCDAAATRKLERIE